MLKIRLVVKIQIGPEANGCAQQSTIKQNERKGSGAGNKGRTEPECGCGVASTAEQEQMNSKRKKNASKTEEPSKRWEREFKRRGKKADQKFTSRTAKLPRKRKR